MLDAERWFRVEDESAIGAVRRATARVGDAIGLSHDRVAEAALGATEIATNLVRHARDGSVIIRPVARDGRRGIGLLALDQGPGMADTLASARDGHTTGGTLGLGLGVIGRMTSWSTSISTPGVGTILAVEFWDGEAPRQDDHACITRPITGEDHCGDAMASRAVDGHRVLLAVDGLGHGTLAAEAAAKAVDAFHDLAFTSVTATVSVLHDALRHSRGAALAVADLDLTDRTVSYAGIGNIAGWVIDGDARQGMISMPGIAGHQVRRIREQRYDLPPDARVVLHSDGLTSKWTMPAALAHREPVLAAAWLLREAGVRHDDASVMVAAA